MSNKSIEDTNIDRDFLKKRKEVKKFICYLIIIYNLIEYYAALFGA